MLEQYGGTGLALYPLNCRFGILPSEKFSCDNPMRYLMFDLDGTLIDSAPSILESFAAVLDAFGITPVVALESGIIGPPLAATLQHISGVGDTSRLSAMADAFKAHYDEAGYKKTVPYADIDDVLAELHRRGNPLYIVTNKRIAPTRKILAHLGWADLFSGVYAQDAFVPALSSKAAVIGAALRSHEIKTADAVYVGDREEDGEAATANQLPFVWAQWGYGSEITTALLETCRAIDSPHELLVI